MLSMFKTMLFSTFSNNYLGIICCSYVKGDGVAQCLMGTANFEFETPSPTPVCASDSELACGSLADPANGKVVFEDANTAYFTCNEGYYLVGAEPSVSIFLACLAIQSTC